MALTQPNRNSAQNVCKSHGLGPFRGEEAELLVTYGGGRRQNGSGTRIGKLGKKPVQLGTKEEWH